MHKVFHLYSKFLSLCAAKTSKAQQEEIAGTFLVLLDPLISQLLKSQPFVQAVLASKLGKLQNRLKSPPLLCQTQLFPFKQSLFFVTNFI